MESCGSRAKFLQCVTLYLGYDVQTDWNLFPAFSLEPGLQINWDDFIDKIFSVEIISVIAADKMSEHFTIFVSWVAFPSSKTLWIVKFLTGFIADIIFLNFL